MARSTKLTSAKKAEQQAAALQAALAWPSFPEPQAYTETTMSDLSKDLGSGRSCVVKAWSFNTHSREVGQGCFNASLHSRWSTTSVNSQGQGGPWYATQIEAEEALAWAIARDCASVLLRQNERLAKLRTTTATES